MKKLVFPLKDVLDLRYLELFRLAARDSYGANIFDDLR